MTENNTQKDVSAPDKNPEILVTDLAIEKIKEFAAEEGKAGFGLKVTAHDNDEFEPAYEMDFQKAAAKDQQTIKASDIEIYLDDESHANMLGATIDFAETAYGTGFRIINPRFRAGCMGSCEECGLCD